MTSNVNRMAKIDVFGSTEKKKMAEAEEFGLGFVLAHLPLSEDCGGQDCSVYKSFASGIGWCITMENVAPQAQKQRSFN